MDEIVFERATYFEHDGYKIMEHLRAKRQWFVYREEWKFSGGLVKDMVTVQAMRQFGDSWHFAKRIKGKHYDMVRWPSGLNTHIAQAIMNCVNKDEVTQVTSEDSISQDLDDIGG